MYSSFFFGQSLNWVEIWTLTCPVVMMQWSSQRLPPDEGNRTTLSAKNRNDILRPLKSFATWPLGNSNHSHKNSEQHL